MASPVQSPPNDSQSLAFTIQFGDQKVDSNKKLKIQERLSSSLALKHRRNPSLPDFRAVKNLPTPTAASFVLKEPNKCSYQSEGYFSIEHEDETSKYKSKKQDQDGLSPVVENKNSFLNGSRKSSPIEGDLNVEENLPKGDTSHPAGEEDNLSEAGTYTVGKEDEEEEEEECMNISHEESTKMNPNHKWINDWVSKVAEQNFQYVEEPPIVHTRQEASLTSSPTASKIPSPINTLPSKLKTRTVVKTNKIEEKSFVSKLNGSLHRRSSSLSAKDYADHRTNDSTLDTESFLKTTELVVTAMQNRMRLSLDSKETRPRSRKDAREGLVERPHPPSTASDTDTNSESEGRTMRKPAPFTSTRLNRAFSLRRAKAEPEERRGIVPTKDEGRPTTPHELRRAGPVSKVTTVVPNSVKPKPPNTSPFSRTDCGRFSMRSTVTTPRSTPLATTNTKKDGGKKLTNSNGRSNSSLSSREVEFQNWKRRKSFDPMKAAAEGRKKEAAKKAAMTQSMTQSVNLGTTIRTRNGNPVLRSASFHSTPHGANSLEPEEDQLSVEDYEDSPASSWISNQPVLPPNSPSKSPAKSPLLARLPIGGSRCSLNSGLSETHSSPSHRARREVLDNLVMAAIHDLSAKLKVKSCSLLKKLNSLYEADDERSDRLQEEISELESRCTSSSGSPNHQVTSRDLTAALKNLKSLEGVLSVLDDVLFDESLQVCIDN